MKGLRKKVRSYDKFGHPVKLNFNQQGDTSQNMIGGLIGIALRIFGLWFLTKQSIIMVKKQNNRYDVQQHDIIYEDVGEINFNESNIIFYMQIRDTWSYGVPTVALAPEEAVRYMFPSLGTYDSDQNFVQMEMIPCTIEDFKGSEDVYKQETEGVEGSLYCPKDSTKMQLENNYKINPEDFNKRIMFSLYPCPEQWIPNCQKNEQMLNLFYSRYFFQLKYVSDKLDYSIYGQKPTKRVARHLKNVSIDKKKSKYSFVDVRSNQIVTQDSFLQYGQSQNYQFWEMDIDFEFEIDRDETSPLNFFVFMEFKISQIEIVHSRQIYDILALLGDFGATTGFIELIVSIIMGPIADHIFTLRAMKKMFVVKNEKKKRKLIMKFGFFDSLKLFLMSYFCCRPRSNLWKLYEKGQNKIQKEFDLLRIISKLQFLIKKGGDKFTMQKHTLNLESEEELDEIPYKLPQEIKTQVVTQPSEEVFVKKPPEVSVKRKTERVPGKSREWQKIIQQYEKQNVSPKVKKTQSFTQLNNDSWYEMNDANNDSRVKIKTQRK